MRLVALDFETYYDSKDYTLSKMGPIEYIRDKRFLPLCVGVYASDVHAAGHYPPAVVELDTMGEYLHDLHLEQGDTFVVGHNMAGFDALVLSEYFGIHPAHILDTIVMSRWCGISRVIPESHGSLTPYLGNGEKEAGTVVSNGKKSKEDFTPEDWDFFKQYCADDTLQCYKNCMDMLPYQTNDAIMFGDLTAKMATQPMIYLDTAMLAAYIKQLDDRAEQAMRDMQATFGFADKESFLKAIRSSTEFCAMLRCYGAVPPMKLSAAKTKTNRERILKAAQEAQAQGIDNSALLRAYDTPEVYEVYAPSLSKTDLDFVALAESPDEHVAALVRARLEFNSSIERSRAERLLKLGASGKAMPVMLKAFAAHTSRYGAGNSEGASDGTNVQNLSKRDPNKLLIRQAMKAPVGYKFVSVDSSQIEARMLAFIAKQTGLVNHFKEGRDPYAELAEKIFQVPAKEIHDGAKSGNKKLKAYRNVGKTCILSCFAGDTEVLTDTGWKRIDSVSKNDKLWDGETWQTHDGLICNGKKNTISLAGINVTPDHLIFDGSSWRTAEEYQREPSYLNRALSIGDTALSIVSRTIGALTRCSSASTSLKQSLVYDIRNVGPNHRYVVRTKHGALLVHNCGYGVGAQKFSDTLLRQGVKLDDDLDKHFELAKHAHNVYRMDNQAIVYFWDQCQGIIEAMERGAEGYFGGPNNKAFHYMQATLPKHTEKYPCIELCGTGYKLWYPNLHWEQGERKVEYFYDRQRGKNAIKTKIYGGALTENCCKRGTLVLTNHGWKPIEAVSISDLVYDGTSFVHHSGVVSKGVQDCIEVNGCWFTSDHLLMENGAWTYAKDCKRPDRIEVRKACSSVPYQFSESAMAVGVSLRLRSHSGEGRQGSSESCEAWQHTAVPGVCKEGHERAYTDAWDDKNAHICGMAFYGTALHRAYASSLGALRRAWHYSLRTLAKVRELSRRYGEYISERIGLGQDRQQCWVFAGELPLGNATGKCEEWSQLSDYRRGGIVQANRNKSVNHILSACSWVAHSIDSSHKTESREHKAALAQRQTIKREEVFDILNCGERHCFTVMGDYPMLAHNCIQSLAFQLLMWQACRMNEAGIRLIANIHDAWLACVPEAKAEATQKAMELIMSAVPPWLEGFPVACEGELGDTYEIA